MHVFQEGFLASRRAADVGVPSVPLVDLYQHAASIIERAGGSVRFGAGVESISPRAVRMSRAVAAGDDAVLMMTGELELRADVVVCAIPVERVCRVVDAQTQAADARFAALNRFTHSPILGVHLMFDRPVLPHPHAVLVERPTQWLFRKDNRGCVVHAVISAADEWMPLSEEQIAQRVCDDIRACFPVAHDATLVSARAVKEKLATFAPVPGLDDARPPALGPAGRRGIVLAGDYTATGWPATMEGAARSGYAAAAAALGVPAHVLMPPPLAVAPLLAAIGFRPHAG
jgi:hydroxysqualene dehydroxylase